MVGGWREEDQHAHRLSVVTRQWCGTSRGRKTSWPRPGLMGLPADRHRQRAFQNVVGLILTLMKCGGGSPPAATRSSKIGERAAGEYPSGLEHEPLAHRPERLSCAGIQRVALCHRGVGHRIRSLAVQKIHRGECSSAALCISIPETRDIFARRILLNTASEQLEGDDAHRATRGNN